MPQFLVDSNLPSRFSIWNDDLYMHQNDLGDTWTDNEIWEYARQKNLTIITKDSDFSDRIMMSDPPPRVIHIKLGNMKLSLMFEFLSKHWSEVIKLSQNHKLINVFRDHITLIE